MVVLDMAEWLTDGVVGCAVIAAIFALGWMLGARSGPPNPSMS